MSASRRTRRRRGLRPIGPALVALVDALQADSGETVEIRISADTVAAIARIDARDNGSLNPPELHPASEAATAVVTVDRATAERWLVQAWRAVGEGLLAPAHAQELSDQLAPRGAA